MKHLRPPIEQKKTFLIRCFEHEEYFGKSLLPFLAIPFIQGQPNPRKKEKALVLLDRGFFKLVRVGSFAISPLINEIDRDNPTQNIKHQIRTIPKFVEFFFMAH